MRPIGAAAAGFAGDFLDRERVLGILLLLAAIALAGLVVLPTGAATGALAGHCADDRFADLRRARHFLVDAGKLQRLGAHQGPRYRR